MTKYSFPSVRRGDYRYRVTNSAEFAAAMRADGTLANSPEERWHFREELSYALAARCFEREPWMDEFLGVTLLEPHALKLVR